MTGVVSFACDPGECTGLAWGIGDRLVACDAATPADDLIVPDVVANFGQLKGYGGQALFELPKFYPPKVYGHPKKATAIGNSLIREAVTLGRWEERAVKLGLSIEEFIPRTWKGSVNKRTMCERIIARMTRDERKMVAATLKASKLAKSKTHNVLDAIGMFFWKVGRL